MPPCEAGVLMSMRHVLMLDSNSFTESGDCEYSTEVWPARVV